MAAHAFQVNFTPPGVKSGPAGSASPAPVLQLRPFQRPPIVSFGTVKVGAVKCVNLVLANDLDRPVQVSVQKVPEASGFSIADGQVVVEANMEAALTIQWKPAEAGNVRGVLSLTTDTALRLQCILLGSGKAPAVKKGKRPTKPGATSRCAIPLQTLSVNTAVARPVTACVRDSRASANTTITTSSAVTRAVSPLNSTHFLETGCESAGVKNRLRTPPDLSVSAISSVDADSVARRQTFVVKDGPAPSATDLETPLRRLTFLRDTENVPPVTGEGRAPISCDPALLETPPELRRRTTYTAEAVPVTVKQEAVVNSIGADKLSVLPTPVLFPRTVRCKAEPLSPIVSDEENDSAARQPEPIAIGDFLQTPQLFGRTYKCAVSRESRGFAPLTSSPHHDSPLLECMPVARVSTPHAATVSAGVADDPQCSPALSPRSSENRHLAVVEPKVVPPPRLTPTSTCATQSADRTFTIGTTGGVQAVEGGIITSEVKTELATEHDDIGRVPDLVISSTPQTHDSAAIATISTAGAAELPAAMFVPFDSPSAHQMATPISRRQRLVSHLEQRRRGHTPKRLTLPVTPGRRRRASNLSAKRERPVLSSSVRPRVVAKAAARVSVPRRPASLRLISAAQKTRSAQIPLVQPSVFLNRGSLYDKDWAEKRGRGLAAWINMILTPSEEFRSTAVEKRVDSARLMVDLTQSHVPPAPSAETLSLRAYTAVRLLNRLRQRAFKLYESAAMVTVLSKIDTAVEQGSIKVRKDRALHVDIGLKQMVVGLLINYHPLWLRLGLETVYGMVIHTRSTDDLTTLVRFIIDRLLWNPQLAAQFSHRSVPHLYTAELEPILKRFALKNLIMLVYFLDVAKRNRLIRHDPCLFNKHAPIKASQEILVAISRELLAGEGCIVKHLSYLGLTVSHVQTKLDEFDYGVNNIAVDLRCGVRLARLIETLTNSPLSLRERLRAPAVDRHQKLYNLKLAVEASGLQLQQLSPAALARQLLDGHKEATLNIIWQLAVKYEIGSADGIVELDKELIALQKSLDNHCFIGNKAAVEGRRLRQQLPSVSESLDTTMNCARTQGSVSASAESSVLSAELTNQLVTCAGRLLSWCRLVCAHYGVSVGNLSSSLRDGRVYCLLLHHYQPLLLPLHSVHQQTADSRIVHTAADSNDDDGDDFQYPSQQIDSKQLAALSRNEKANVALALNVMTQLGGVAVLHTAVDFASFPPDWQLVVLQLKLLSCRLLQLGREQSAARRLQLWWRRHLYCRQLRKQQVQAWYRSIIMMREQRLEYLMMKSASLKIHTWYRSLLLTRKQRSEYLMMKAASLKIQTWYRSLLVAREQSSEYLMMKAASLKIQTWYRSIIMIREQKSRYLKMKAASLRIQTWYRSIVKMREQRSEHLRIKSASLKIQSWYRSLTMMREQRAEYLRMKSVSVYVSIAGITANYSGAEVFKLADIADTVYTRLQIVSVDKSKRCIAESEYIPNYTDCAVSACAVDNISVADSSDFADCLDTTESATSVYSADSVGVADSFCTADSRSIADLADFADSVDFANASNSTNTVDLALCDSAFTDDVNPTDTADVSPTDTADVSPTDTADVSPTDTAEGTTHTDTADVTPTDSSDGTTPTESADGISPTDATYITPADYTDDINPADDTPADVADGTTPADVADGTTPGDSTFTIANDTECADDGTAMLKINSSKFTSLHDAAVLVQSCWRGVLARRVVSQLRCPHSDHLQLIIERLRCFTISLGQQLSAINQLYNLTESNSCCCWALCHHPEGLYTLLQLLANGNRSQPETQLAKINLSVLVHVATVKHCAGRLLQCNGWLDIVLTAMVRHCRCSQLVSLCCRLLLHAISYRPLIKQELYGRHRWRQLLQKWYSEAVRQEKKLKPQPSDSSVTLMNSSTVSQNSHADVHTSSVLLHRLLTTLQHAN